jgi:hypothetical protein
MPEDHDRSFWRCSIAIDPRERVDHGNDLTIQSRPANGEHRLRGADPSRSLEIHARGRCNRVHAPAGSAAPGEARSHAHRRESVVYVSAADPSAFDGTPSTPLCRAPHAAASTAVA